MKPTIEDATVEKIHWTPHEVMMEVEVTYFELMRRVKKCGIKPVFKRRGFVRYLMKEKHFSGVSEEEPTREDLRKAINEFADKLMKNSEDLPPLIRERLNERFWDLL